MIELNPYIILSKPQLGENIGSTARAMKNFWYKNLLLVQPRDGWPNNVAFAPAAGADDVLNQAKLYDLISEATKTISLLFATTARKRVIGTKSLSIFKAIKNHLNMLLMAVTLGFYLVLSNRDYPMMMLSKQITQFQSQLIKNFHH